MIVGTFMGIYKGDIDNQGNAYNRCKYIHGHLRGRYRQTRECIFSPESYGAKLHFRMDIVYDFLGTLTGHK